MPYKLIYTTAGNVSHIDLDGLNIPIDNQNSDFLKFLAWNSAQSKALDIQDSSVVSQADMPISISASSSNMIGDGEDEIVLTIQGTPNKLMTIVVLTGQTVSEFDIQLNEFGLGTQVFSCETRLTKIIFQHGDVTCEVRAF